MAIYGLRRKRATKKARAKKKSDAGTRTAAAVEAARKKAKARAKARTKRGSTKVRAKATSRAKKPAAKKTTAKKPVAKKTTAKKPVAKKTTAKKPAAKKTTAKKPAAKKLAAKKTAAKKPAAKKPVAKRSTKAERAEANKRAFRAKARREARALAREQAERAEARAEAKRQAALKRRKKKRAAERKETEKIRAELAELRAIQQADRGKGKKSPAQKAVRKKKISEERIAAAQAIAHPRKKLSASEQGEFRESEYKRLDQRFWTLFGQAVSTGQTPAKKRLPLRVNSRGFIGEQRRIRVERILRPSAVPDIMYKVDQSARKMSGKFPMWWAGLAFSGMGERLFASGNQVLLSKDPDARFFQAQGYDNTGLYGSYAGMRHVLEGMLEDYAAEPRTTVYLHFVWLRNIQRR